MIRILGDLYRGAAKTTFVLLLFLVSKGNFLTHEAVEGKWQALAFLFVLTASYIATCVQDGIEIGSATTRFIYDSPPGIAFASLNALAGMWFVISVGNTYRVLGQKLRYEQLEDDSDQTTGGSGGLQKAGKRKQRPKAVRSSIPSQLMTVVDLEMKRRLYIGLGIVYSLYYLSFGFIALLAPALPSWIREKVCISLEFAIATVAFSSLAVLNWLQIFRKPNTVDVNTPYQAM